MQNKNLKILFASSEVAPFAKTGGLADVSGSLPKALAAMNHDVRIVLPKYKQINEGEYLTDFPVEMNHHLETAIIRRTTLRGKSPTSKFILSITINIFIETGSTVLMTKQNASTFSVKQF